MASVPAAHLLRTLAASIVLALAAAFSTAATAGSGLSNFTDDQLEHGFFATVFGLEHGARAGGQIVKKYAGPVRIAIENGAEPARTKQVAAFVRKLPGLVPGLDVRLAGPGETPNYVVHIVQRSSYIAKVQAVAYSGSHGKVPGRCMVKVDFGSSGIRRSDAFIVADEGEPLFQRCMVEEILQGLGPMNDDNSLVASVFNDSSTHTRLMAFDRAIVTMLYDDRIHHGMRAKEVSAILPEVLDSTRQRVR